MTKPHLVLIGLMGVGKTLVGRECASQLGWRFVDTDDLVEARVGAPVREIFAREGEPAFRRYEREAVASAVAASEPTVISCGGGVAVDPENRASLRARGTVVLLTAPVTELVDRIGADANRPLLGANPEEVLNRLAEARRDFYERAADAVVDTGGHSVEAVVAAVLEHAAASGGDLVTVPVRLGDRSYTVEIGPHAFSYLPHAVWGRQRAVIVTQASIDAHYGERVRSALDSAGVTHATMLMGDGEHAKTLATHEHLVREFAQWGLLRNDVVIALGGGIVGDVAGFAAASFHRGVGVVQVPTTLLAMVDSSIGGKTGVNLPEGKNLVGAFHQPIAVVADTSTLATLPDREFRAGLGECIKYALLGDEELEAVLRTERDAVLARDPAVVARLVEHSAAAKARVVEADEFERLGRRASLNLGHTLGHAIEVAGGHELAHGEAVAVGLVFATELAAALGRISSDRTGEVRSLIDAYGLPTRVPAGLDAEQLQVLMRRDKKADGGLTFVLDGPDGVRRVDDPDAAALDRAFAAVGLTKGIER